MASHAKDALRSQPSLDSGRQPSVARSGVGGLHTYCPRLLAFLRTVSIPENVQPGIWETRVADKANI